MLYREPAKIRVEKIDLTFLGLMPQIQKSFLSKDVDAPRTPSPPPLLR